MEKKISYLSNTYDDYKRELIELSKKYYPDLNINYDDASVASWFIDLNADVADALRYHIDRVFQETNINSAQEKASMFNLARNNGFKIPGPKGAMAEVQFSCYVPKNSVKDEPDWNYAPIIKRGTKVASSTQNFELLYDVDFREAFSDEGISDRTILPVRDSNGNIGKYQITKLAIVVAGESRVYKQTVYSNDIKPFMEIVLTVENVMNVESIVVKEGNSLQSYPSYGEFYMGEETNTKFPTTTRFFEVNNLAEQERWGEQYNSSGSAVRYQYGYEVDGKIYPTYSITKGEWKELKHKFTTEYTDSGYLKVVFGAGIDSNVDVDITDASDFMKYRASKMIKNDNLGVLPNPNTTIFILYRCGGGKSSNVAKGGIKTISTLNIEIPATSMGGSSKNIAEVKSSMKVKNTTPSVSGKDMPTTEELKYMIKYSNGAQERCVTVKDYISRILELPAKYGTPFRVGAIEDNNKIMVYLLGLDYNGRLDSALPAALVENIQTYLAKYRMINDFVEMKSGKIINLSFEVDAYIDKNYNKTDIFNNIVTTIKDYMDINKHQMGDDIFIGDIEKEISKIDGVIGLIDVRVFNECNSTKYSSTMTSQEIVSKNSCDTEGSDTYEADRLQIDLDASDGIIYSDGDTMLEVKYDTDIRVQFKER